MLAGRSWRMLTQTVPGYRPLAMEGLTYCGGEQHIDFARGLDGALNAAGLRDAIVHVDLDCLDTPLGLANEYAAPGGLTERERQDLTKYGKPQTRALSKRCRKAARRGSCLLFQIRREEQLAFP